MMKAIAGDLLLEGKTKKIWQTKEISEWCIIESKDDITAGDGAKHDLLPGKGALATKTVVNIFRFLQSCGLPVAFIDEIDATKFLAPRCTMIPYEVVVRREAHGSFLKRYPPLPKGHLFNRLVLEFFLKTTGRKWEGKILPQNDPLVQFQINKALLFLPDQPLWQQQPCLSLDDFPLKGRSSDLKNIQQTALTTFLVLEKAWQILGLTLADLKVEFGTDEQGRLYITDVIDNDSWRVLKYGRYIDKQLYRDGTPLETVLANYQLVQELTERFTVPRQQLILWRGSEKDNLEPFLKALASYQAQIICETRIVTCSLHKEPLHAIERLTRLVQEIPDTVVIAFVGKSNGAGPILSTQTAVPVLTVPAEGEKFPEDVWSSLRTPSQTPVATLLDPGNAVLAALQILALHNPRLYATLRLQQEERFINTVAIP